MVQEPPQELLEDCKSGKVVLFAGSGVAASAGLPTGEQLLRCMLEVLGEVDHSKYVEDLRSQIGYVELSLIADVLQLRVGEAEVQRLLERAIRAEHDPPLFQVLSKVPFAGVITTILYSAFDRAFASRGPVVIGPSTPSLAAVLRAQQFFLLKAYGDLGELGRLLFSFGEQYRESVSKNPEYGRFVSSAVANGTLLFLGTSPAEIKDFLNTIELRSRPERAHFALVPGDKSTALEQERMVGLYNVTLLPYEASPGTRGTEELDRFVRLLSYKLRERRQVNSPPALRPEVLREVVLRNIGPFVDFSLPVNKGWNVLLGDNACGKSSVLRAVALALCGDDNRAEHAATSLLRSGTKEGSIELRAGKSVYRTHLLRDENRVRVSPDAITPVQAGAWLAPGFPPLRGVSYSRISGASKEEGAPNPVVDDLLPLVDPSGVDTRLDDLRQWIVNASASAALDKTRGLGSSRSAGLLDSFFEIVQRLAPGLPFKFIGVDPVTWEILVETEDGTIPIQRLSQGMSAFLNWVGTLLERLYEVYGESQHPESEKALVLLDEVDAHLHPRWQQQVIPLLRDVFPQLQVLATTHSPLIVSNLLPGELCYHLRRDGSGGGVTAKPIPIEALRGRADQILTGPAFDLASTRDQATQELMEEYSSLLAIPAPTEAERDRLAHLEMELERVVPSHQETEEARRAGELVEEWLNERLQDLPTDEKEKIVKEAKLYLAGMGAGESDA